MKPITYKLATDSKGATTGLELWQDGQHITITFDPHAQTHQGYRWHEVRERIELLAKQIEKAAAQELNLPIYK